MKKKLLRIVTVLSSVYILICTLLYFFQEQLIFLPSTLNKNYPFHFDDQQFEELNIKAADGKLLNALLFHADGSKGLIFFLHGNAGCLAGWGNIAKTYTALHYDVFMIDYRSYGKSEGTIKSEKQFFSDLQTAYDQMKQRYTEDHIVVLGYSIGTGPAAEVASTNQPRLLILQAPYYSLSDMMQHRYPGVPTFLLNYKFDTDKYLKACKMPVVIFHGDDDETIYYGSSLKLKKDFKPGDTLITLPGGRHGGMSDNEDYQLAIARLLNSPAAGLAK